jgi:serine/threonine protein kinase
MSDFQTYKVGEKIGDRVTVTDIIVEPDTRHPVYMVWDHQGWCSAVLKVFRNSRKAAQEHEVLTKVAHPNIVKSLGTYEPAMMLMEYLEGPTLDHYSRSRPRGRMSLSDTLRAMVHLGGALEHVHKRGYVHLDIKPGNVIVAGGRPVLFDFGTARKIGGERPSVVQGTDAYMPPEECELGAVSPASDVFSLGVTLFELLTDEIPFPEPTEEMPYPQLHHIARPLRELRPDVPRALEQAVAACLEREPANRPTMGQLLPELNRHIRSGAKMWPAMVDLKPAAANDLGTVLAA